MPNPQNPYSTNIGNSLYTVNNGQIRFIPAKISNINNNYCCCPKYVNQYSNNPPTAFENTMKPVKVNDFNTKYNPIDGKSLSYHIAQGQIPGYFDNYEQYLNATKPKKFM